MSPWEVIGWIFVALLICLLVAVIVVAVLFGISISLFVRDKKVEVLAKEREEVELGLRLYDIDPKLGKLYMIGENTFKVLEQEVEYLPERGSHQVRLTLGQI